MSNKLQHKLFNYQAEPPADGWDKIAAALDEQAPSFPERLFHFQQQPAPHVWEQIEQQLDEETGVPATKIIPLKPYSRILKYMAAAVILLLISGAFYLYNNSTFTASEQQTANQSVLNIKSPAKPAVPVATENKKIKDSAALMAVNTEPEENNINNIHKQKTKIRQLITTKKSSVVLPEDEEPLRELAVIPKEKNIINQTDTDRYIIVTSDVGNAVRLPKKVYSSFACPDQFAFAGYDDCKERISSLQNKMSASMTTDFAGLLDLLKNLQENSN
jgi:hypothetical protein